jgi:hypothetical protein
VTRARPEDPPVPADRSGAPLSPVPADTSAAPSRLQGRRLRARRAARGLGLALGLGALALVAEAAARPGGGHSYSGGSRSYSGGGRSYSGGGHSDGGGYSGGGHSDGGGTLAAMLLVLAAAIPYAFVLARTLGRERFDSAPAPRPLGTRQPYAALRQHDPEFSAVLFEDFVYALYARVHGARHDPAALDALGPYVSYAARAALHRRAPGRTPLHGVVIGRMQVERVTITDRVRAELVFESNFTAGAGPDAVSYYSHEHWTLTRARDLRTRPPGAVQSFPCPACGAPFRRGDDGRCAHCHQHVEDGRFDWSVDAVHLFRQTSLPPTLTGHVEEVGTGDPTVFDPEVGERYAALVAGDPDADATQIERRVRTIYAALNAAWSARDLRPVRPHVSDALFDYLQYWIDAYRAQGLRNVLEDGRISRLEIVKLVRDRHFDALTVRLFASGRDYTVTDDGRRISGRRWRRRAYSEYWTLIRGAGVRGAPRDPARCPGCGAALDRVNMAGACEYCGAHLTRGEFDWVLSKIEQDEAYTG